jgi:SAM-dependent methyltransferase
VSDVFAYVRDSLPPPPARVLEVGAGEGELALALAGAGYDVLAIDPAATAPPVQPVALLELSEPDASFDAAVACVSLHHVEPLEESCARLADVVRPGGRLIVDEFDIDQFDEPAAQWWIDRRTGGDHEPGTAAAVIERLRDHIHPVSRLVAELEAFFDLEQPLRGAYLYRWSMPDGLEPAEREAIASGAIPATGIRFTATRRPIRRSAAHGS